MSTGGRWRRLARTQTRRNPSGISSGRGRSQAVISGRLAACVLAGGATSGRSVPGGAGAGRGRDQLAVGDGVDDLLGLFLLLAPAVRLGVTGDAHHARGHGLVGHHGEPADDVALLPADALDVEVREVHLGRRAAPRAGPVVDLLGLADGLHVLAGRLDAHARQTTPRGSEPPGELPPDVALWATVGD